MLMKIFRYFPECQCRKIQQFYIKNIYKELRNYVNNYIPRKSYLMLIEGCEKADKHIVHYLFNEMVCREICSFYSKNI